MQQLFNDGKLSIIQGVSYPTPNFSHFRASDIWMTAVDQTQTSTSGWAGRYLDKRFPGFPDSYPTTHHARPAGHPDWVRNGNIALLGPTNSMAIVLQDPDTFARLSGRKTQCARY